MLASIIPAHDLATWLLKNIDHMLDLFGLAHHQTVEQVIYFTIIVGASYFIGWLIKKLILFVTKKMVKLRDTSAGRDLLRQRTFTKCSHVIPPLVFLSLAPFAFDGKSLILTIIMRLSIVYLIVMLGVGVNAVLSFIFTRYDERENTRNLPIKGILNVSMGIVWIIVAIVSVSVIVQKSPAALLGGMTAFAAVLMLVFKDSILGFVAGMQMSQNDMLHVGDWIVVPNTLANGTVEDVSLTTVKVRNFDNTLVMVPPYTLVSGSFQNWRGMSETGVRRVAQEVYINPDTIRAPEPERVAALSQKFPALKDFIDKMQASGQTIAWNKGVAPLNGTTETNLGLFRAYLVTYLTSSDMIDPTRDLMVRVLPMSAQGTPLQIYCFVRTTQWEAWEGVRSALLERVIMLAPEFGLQVLSSNELNVSTSGDKKIAASAAPAAPAASSHPQA